MRSDNRRSATDRRRGRPRPSCDPRRGSRPSRRDRPGRTHPTAISATFEVSKIPSHRMNSGTQAIEGIARSACTVGSSRRTASAASPISIPRTVPATTPRRSRAHASHRGRRHGVYSSPVWPADQRLRQIRDGGGISRPLNSHGAPQAPTRPQGRPAESGRAPARIARSRADEGSGAIVSGSFAHGVHGHGHSKNASRR